MTKRPLDILDQVLNRQPVIVSLKGGRELRGILQGYDVHMNLVLDKAEEVVEGGQVRGGSRGRLCRVGTASAGIRIALRGVASWKAHGTG